MVRDVPGAGQGPKANVNSTLVKPSAMPRRPKSAMRKRHEYRKDHDNLMSQAVSAYRTELQKLAGVPRRSSRTICKDFEQTYLQATGKSIKLSHATLSRLTAGGRSLAEMNEAKSWLTPEETECVLAYAKETADRGFPFSHRRLREHVNEILTARLGPNFPGVGKCWSDCFVAKHADHLKTSWASPLDSKRGRAVNPNTNKAWFDLLEAVSDKLSISEDCIYAVDEIGISPQSGERERVIGSQKRGPQYQQRTGSKENTTVIVTICADGTTTPPAVIFKGNAYQVKWKQDNPANAL